MSTSHNVRRRPEQPEAIPNQYIVVFKPTVTSQQRAAHRAWAAERHFSALSVQGNRHGLTGLHHKFNINDGEVAGYTAKLTEDVMQEINNTDEVDFVEPDYKVYTCDIVEQKDVPSWGLPRLSSKTKVQGHPRVYRYDDEAAGEGTTSYVIDTGVLVEHEDFEGRATFGHNAVPNSTDTDKNGHGTHVAGTIGGKLYGVAKKTKIVAVKVLGDSGEGTNSGVIAGIEWALKDAEKRGIKKCVANMSLGGSKSAALNRVVKAAFDKGLTFVVAAGNEGSNAEDSSPASEPTAITVGATAENDAVPDFSNWGPRVDIFAPGVQITSTWIDESGGGATNLTNTISGTSMASPHVCGLVAYLISKDPSLDTPKEITAKVKSLGLKGQIESSSLQKGSVNLLAYNGEGSS